MEIDVDDLIRVKTAGDYMRVTSQYIYTLIKSDRLKSTEIDGVTFVSRKAVHELQAERDKNRKN